MREMSWEDFADAAGRSYTIQAGGNAVELTLDRVQELPPSGRTGGSFRLEFLGPLEPLLPQAIYPFSDGDGVFEIFVVPVAREPSGVRYEAVFF
jgi:hypothetical protein